MLPAYTYPVALAAISVLVWGLERLRPWRPEQPWLQRSLASDLVHLVFNGHFLGVILFGLASHHVLPAVDRWLAQAGAGELVYRDAAASWPLWAQIVVALLLLDLLQWGVHRLLHRVPWLWELHKCHHSVVDGEMSWIVAFRFQWAEVVVYKSLLYLPLAFFGFGEVAVMTHAIFGTLIGHLNHANLPWDYGPLRYVLNNPRMHLWHHDYDATARSTVNFGIIFSVWDWIFGTAKVPAAPPRHIGFRGVERFPSDFLGHAAWPLQRLLPPRLAGPLGMVAGVGLLAFGWWAHLPPSPASDRSAGEQPTPACSAGVDHGQQPEHAAVSPEAFEPARLEAPAEAAAACALGPLPPASHSGTLRAATLPPR